MAIDTTALYMGVIARNQASIGAFTALRKKAARSTIQARSEAKYHAANALLIAYCEAERHFNAEIHGAREALAHYTAPWFEVRQ